MCTCPVYELKLIYECSVNGGINTVWLGPDFKCPSTDDEIILRHSQFSGNSEVVECNNGDIIGHTLYEDKGHFTSQLNVTVSNGLNSTIIECARDDGTNLHDIGRMFTMGKYCNHRMNDNE